ncbi:universal stress protein [Bryobacter aggregatus]|uniref:universal stress protein n=1 Tax=Bryobacter aggregatus TaxID=360054 RepID=UPI0004E1179D|nr:universal stress protein [Bryobacter aggregatus]
MKTQKKLLFVTNFSEACFHAIPGPAEWVDREQGELTLLHVHAPGKRQGEIAGARLKSFFSEADHYAQCSRVLLAGDPVTEIVDYCRRENPELVFCPASQPLGFPRLFHRSMRAELVRAGVRIWTRGRAEQLSPIASKPKNVSYVMTGHPTWIEEASWAAELARSAGATLHIIYQTPWPEVHEGMVAADIRLEKPNVSLQELQRLEDQFGLRTSLHVTAGTRSRDLGRLLADCQTDLAVVGEKHAVRHTLFSSSINAELERLHCEVVCLPVKPLTTATESTELVLSQPLLGR